MQTSRHVAAVDAQHSVQFYRDDEFLATVVIATPEHAAIFRHYLSLSGIPLDEVVAKHQLMLLDARQTLGEFMVAGRPDPERFDRVVGGVIRAAAAESGGSVVRAYGEMVDVLWRDGQRGAAIQLEELWTELASAPGSRCCARTAWMGSSRPPTITD